MRKLFMSMKRPAGASDYYRTILPHKFLGSILRDYGIQSILEYDYTRHSDLAAVAIQRHAPAELICYLLERQSRGMKLVWDCDDDLLGIPPWSPAYHPHLRSEIVSSRVIADRVWTTTRTLANEMEKWGNAKSKRAVVLANLIDLDAWQGGNVSPEDDDSIRICWSGTATHEKDVAILEPVLDIILPKYPHVQFIYFGEIVPEWLLAKWFDRIHHSEWVALNGYPKQLRYINPHIFLCPLSEHRFNHSKSAIKGLEATLAGAAVVCSPLPPYQIERDPIWGFAATTDEWVERISELIEDREKRQRQQGKALEVVSASWSWQNSKHAQLWLAAILDLMDYRPGEQKKEEAAPVAKSGVADAMKRLKGVV